MHTRQIPCSLIAVACLFALTHGHVAAAETALATVRFEPTDELLANPGQGWLNSQRLPSTVRYTRMNWMDLEPADGKYDWA